MNNEELLDDLEREWTRAMEKVNEIENKIVQVKGIMARDAAEHRHAPVTGQATDKADSASDENNSAFWECSSCGTEWDGDFFDYCPKCDAEL